MAYLSYKELWGNEFYKHVSTKGKEQDIKFSQLKLKVNDA